MVKDDHHPDQSNTVNENDETDRHNNLAADMVFTIVLGIFMIALLIHSLGYHITTLRGPLFAMIPMVILLIIHFIRMKRQTNWSEVVAFLKPFLSLKEIEYKRTAIIIMWLVIFTIMIFILGHYVGSALFLLIMLRLISKESWRLTLILMAAVPVTLYLLFEAVIGLQLYQGLIYMYWQGYNIF